jgi:hypothetical protein
MAHIVDRFVIHFFCSAGVLLCAFFSLRFAVRRLKTKFLPPSWESQLVFAALSVFCAAALREAWDVHNGQEIAKAFTDYASWFLGCGLSAWGLVRLIREVRI